MSRKLKAEYVVPLVFSMLCVICFIYAGVSLTFLVNQVMLRFIRNGIMVLALIIPIMGGLGLNFAVVVGAMASQMAYLFVLNSKICGSIGFLLVILLSIILSIMFGLFVGKAMNIAKGREMITSIIIGFLANYIYQLIFMVGFGTVIPVNNKEIVLANGIGVNNMVDLAPFKGSLDKLLAIKIGAIDIPLLWILIVLIFSYLVYYILNTKLGYKIRAIGMSMEKSAAVGIDVNSIRVIALVISTTLAAIGQLIYLKNMGVMNVYTGHLNTDTFSCAALLAGGATIKKASVRNALLGIILLHTLFILSPLAGQNVFNNVSLGEYFRSFIAYGTIAFALIMNMKHEDPV